MSEPNAAVTALKELQKLASDLAVRDQAVAEAIAAGDTAAMTAAAQALLPLHAEFRQRLGAWLARWDRPPGSSSST